MVFCNDYQSFSIAFDTFIRFSFRTRFFIDDIGLFRVTADAEWIHGNGLSFHHSRYVFNSDRTEHIPKDKERRIETDRRENKVNILDVENKKVKSDG